MEINWKDQLKLGNFSLKNRVFMAALTRERCDPKLCIPTPLVAQYYAQRAGSGLMLSEATSWSPRGRGFVGAACLYNKEQMEGWKAAINAVHQKGGNLFLQIFHCGRVTHPLKIQGLQPWAPSAIAVRQKMRDLEGKQFPVPKQMTLQDIEQTKRQFEDSIILAKEAGFDGIQIHGAHGYLVDSFLRSESNKRTDKYGGSVENRLRFALELFDITLKYFPAERVGIKISPVSRLKDMYDQNPLETYSQFLKELDKKKIGFVEIRQSTEFYPFTNMYPLTQKQQMFDVCKQLRPYFSGIIIGNDSFNPETGLQKMRAGLCDAISFGRFYISNPDLAQRIINGHEINSNWDGKTFYGCNFGAKGFTDYPFYKNKQ